jgi:transcriptional regulator with XRE-family HTH domain
MKPEFGFYNPDPAYLRGLRGQTRLSQSHLAARFGISRRIVQYYEAAEWMPTHRTATYLYQYALEQLAAVGE